MPNLLSNPCKNKEAKRRRDEETKKNFASSSPRIFAAFLSLLSFLPYTLYLAIVLIFSGILLLTNPAQAAPPAQVPDTPPSVSGGQALWGENCLPCHGPTGQGDGPTVEQLPQPPPDFSDPVTARQRVPVTNFDTIKNGRIEKLMPPWGNRLSDAQIWDAAAYVWSLGTSPQELAAGEAIYTEQCAACHGQDGAGSGPQATANINNFTNLAVMVLQSQADLQAGFQASSSHTALNPLTEAELWAVLNYIRTFSFVVPQRNGTLTGQVINATTNQPVGNIEVTLHAIQDNAELETLTTQADAMGRYTFENLATDHAVFYVVEGEYEGIGYVGSQPAIFVPDSTTTTADVMVYDTTTNPEAIAIKQLHYVISFAPGEAQVLQIYSVSNGGNQSYIGQDNQTFTFQLPENATNVVFQNDPERQRFIKLDTGYADTAPILPGEEGLTVAALYSIPLNGDSLTIDTILTGDVPALNVLMADQPVILTSPQAQFVEERQFQGDSFSVYTGSNLKQGETVSLALSGLDNLEFTAPEQAGAPAMAGAPATAGATIGGVNQSIIVWVIMGIGAVAIVLAVVVYPLRQPQPFAPDKAEASRHRLLLLIARLDETFERGELDEAIYRQARARYKAELAVLLEPEA